MALDQGTPPSELSRLPLSSTLLLRVPPILPFPGPIPRFSGSTIQPFSDVDALPGALDRLIAKKRDLKQAAMQQLLTGQTRLPGFHGEWEVKRLGDLFNFSGGYSASRDQLSQEGHCYLLPPGHRRPSDGSDGSGRSCALK